MSEEKVYPAFYAAVDGNEFLYADKENYYSFGRECWDVSNGDDNHPTDKNITREYLANTYGEVASPEHAGFIIELAELHGFEFDRVNLELEDAKSFMIYEDSFDIYPFNAEKLSNSEGRKKIAIPLPPKQIQTATPEEEFEMAQIDKNNGDNLMLGGADKCKEWPKIGDEVVASFNNTKVKATLCWQRVNNAGVNVSLVFDSDSRPFWCATEDLEKPKTPDEELRDWMHERIGYGIASGFDCEQITHDLLHHLNITKKPQ